MLRDLRFAIRSLRRSPSFTLLAILSFGVGLGITTVVYEMIDAVLVPYVPYREPNTLYHVIMSGDGANGRVTGWQRASILEESRFARNVAYGAAGSATISVGPRSRSGVVSRVSARFFQLIGARPLIGRVFAASPVGADNQAVILDQRLWREMFPSRAGIEGAAIGIDGLTYDVIGVMPQGVDLPLWSDAWVLLSPDTRPAVMPYVRLGPGADSGTVQRELDVLAGELKRTYGEGRTPFSLSLSKRERDPLRLLQLRGHHAAIGLGGLVVLLVSCINVGNLMLMRGAYRRRDIALTMALGAPRVAAVRQVILEGLLLALTGGSLGVAMALAGNSLLASTTPPDLFWLGIFAPHMSWRAFAVAFAASICCGTACGLIAARGCTDAHVSEPLKEAPGLTARTRRFSAFASAEIAVSLVLLGASCLLVKSLRHLRNYDFGYDARGLIQATVPPGRALDSTGARFGAVMDAVRLAPGVQSLSAETQVAPGGGAVVAEADGVARVMTKRVYRMVSPGFLRTLGIPVVAGRDFEPGDDAGAGVAIVDRRAATRLFGEADPVGRMIKLGGVGTQAPWARVVGVARDVVLDVPLDPATPAEPEVYYVPGRHEWRSGELVLRVSGDPEAESALLYRRLRDVPAPSGGSPTFGPFLAGFAGIVRAREFISVLFAVVGACAVALATVGLYSVVGYSVAQRTRELGIRMALGASPRDLLRMVLKEAAIMILAGTGIGGLLALWAESLLRAFLFDVRPGDAGALVLAEAILIAITTVACLKPAARAMRADPLEIVRST